MTVQPKIKIGTEEVPVPALSVDNMQALGEAGALDPLPIFGIGLLNKDARENAVRAISTALRQERQGTTDAEVRSAVTARNVKEILDWILGAPEVPEKGEAVRP